MKDQTDIEHDGGKADHDQRVFEPWERELLREILEVVEPAELAEIVRNHRRSRWLRSMLITLVAVGTGAVTLFSLIRDELLNMLRAWFGGGGGSP